MKRPPQKFFREYATFRERFDWAARGIEEGDLPQSQLAHAEMLGFLDRWQGKIGIPEFESAFAQLRPSVDQIGRLLEAKYLAALAELLEKRHTVLIEPLIFDAGLQHIKIMQLAPPELLPGLEKIFREKMGYEYDAERFYRESEAAQTEYEAEYKQAFATMEVNWPERFDAEIRARLSQAPIEEINQWKADTAAELAAIEKKIDARGESVQA